MLDTAQHTTKSFKIIELILFLGLCVLSAYFMREVLDKYFSGQTSFTQSEEPLYEYPTITFCFINPGGQFSIEIETRIRYPMT